MGQGYSFKCEKCNYQKNVLFGAGYLFPFIQSETTEKAKNGGFGKELQNFINKYEGAKLNCENVLLQCEKCGEYDVDNNLTTTAKDADENEVVFHYPYKCSHCKGAMRIITEEEFRKKLEEESLLCPKCKTPVQICKSLCWD